MLSIFLFEVLGTSVFVGGASMIDITSPYETILFMCLVYFSALMICTPISGGHFNPAYTLSVFLLCNRKREKLPKMLIMIAAQLVGGAIGFLFSWMTRYKATD
jgi:glycerol uptake facilitator-like aquaporin